MPRTPLNDKEASLIKRIFGERNHVPPVEWSDTVWEPRDDIPVGEVMDISPMDALLYGSAFTKETSNADRGTS